MQVVGVRTRGGRGERGECGSFSGFFWWVWFVCGATTSSSESKYESEIVLIHNARWIKRDLWELLLNVLLLYLCGSSGSCVHVLWLPAGPPGPAGVQPVLPKEPLTLPSPAPSPGLEVLQLHFHAHWVSSHLTVEFLIMSIRPCCRFQGHSWVFSSHSSSKTLDARNASVAPFCMTWIHPLLWVSCQSGDYRNNIMGKQELVVLC